jgi:predicted RNA polymerase sigma factor
MRSFALDSEWISIGLIIDLNMDLSIDPIVELLRSWIGASVEGPVLDGLEKVRGANILGSGQIGDRPGYL